MYTSPIAYQFGLIIHMQCAQKTFWECNEEHIVPAQWNRMWKSHLPLFGWMRLFAPRKCNLWWNPRLVRLQLRPYQPLQVAFPHF